MAESKITEKITGPVHAVTKIWEAMTKLPHLICGILKSGKPFNPNILKNAAITP